MTRRHRSPGVPLADTWGHGRKPDRLCRLFAETWKHFEALEHTLGPSATAIEEWRRGRARYAVWALRVSDPGVLARMAAVADRLADAIVPVRREDAHVTAWVCGFPCAEPALDDDVAHSLIAAQRAAVMHLPPPRLVVGTPNAFATCAFLEVHDPHGDLTALRRGLAVPGAREVRFAPYQPHVTVGRFHDTRPAAAIAAALGAFRTSTRFPPHPFADSALELVILDAHNPDRRLSHD